MSEMIKGRKEGMRDERGLRQVEMRLTRALEGCVLLNLYVIVEKKGSLKSLVCSASLSSRSQVKYHLPVS